MFRHFNILMALVATGRLAAQTVLHTGTLLTVDAGTTLRVEGGQTVTVASGASVVNDGTVIFGATDQLVEATGSPFTGTGVETTTRSFPTPLSAVDAAGLGASISTALSPGTLTVTRGHLPVIDNGGMQSVGRWYAIDPTINSGLAATLTFRYDPSELNGLNEADLTLHVEGPGNYWWYSPSTVDLLAHTVTSTGLDSLGTFTAFDGISTHLADGPTSDGITAWLESGGEVLVVGVPLSQAPLQLVLIDAGGRTVGTEQLRAPQERIDIKHLAPGAYCAITHAGSHRFVKP